MFIFLISISNAMVVLIARTVRQEKEGLNKIEITFLKLLDVCLCVWMDVHECTHMPECEYMCGLYRHKCMVCVQRSEDKSQGYFSLSIMLSPRESNSLDGKCLQPLNLLAGPETGSLKNRLKPKLVRLLYPTLWRFLNLDKDVSLWYTSTVPLSNCPQSNNLHIYRVYINIHNSVS